MDTLQQLESKVQALVADLLETREKLARVEEECSLLQAENLSLRQALAAREELQQQALARVDALMGRLAGRTGAEKVS